MDKPNTTPEDNYDVALIQAEDVGNTSLHQAYHNPTVIVDNLAIQDDGSNTPCYTQVQDTVNNIIRQKGLWDQARSCKFHRLPSQPTDEQNGILAHVRIVQLSFSHVK